MKKWNHLFFDLDGTLVDTSEGILTSAVYAFVKMGLAVPSIDQLRKIIGPPLREGFSRLGVPEDKIEEIVRTYREKYVGQGARFLCCAYPGIENALQVLKENGFLLYVATAKPEFMAVDVLEKCHLESYFTLVAGASLDKTRDKKADVIRYLQSKLVLPSTPILIGDTRYDVEGAKEVGIPSLGVSWGFDDPSVLLEKGASSVVFSPEEMVQYFLG